MDTELEHLKTFFDNIPNLKPRASVIVRRALDYVLDGASHISELESPEKTPLGTKIEKYFLKEFDLPMKKTPQVIKRLAKEGIHHQNPKHDTVIAGIPVDCKNTIRRNWMISPNCCGIWVLLFKTNCDNYTFSMGLLKTVPENVSVKWNGDHKRNVSAKGSAAIHWIIQNEKF